MRYRQDIDGLRALAVLPVVFYHAGFTVFSGGFVGVDVFFVISGFLITGLLLEERERSGSISLLGFYERRIRRIFPALFAVIGATVWATLLLFTPEDLIAFAQSAAAAALFVSNVFFYLELDYFGPGVESAPLLHTWSLAIEEQYYVILPLLMMWALKRSRRLFARIVVGLSIASFAVSLLLTSLDPQANFFLLPSRAWELFAGSCLALGLFGAPRALWHRQAAGLSGLLLVSAPVLLYGPQTEFPGLTALPPVAGAALIIWAGLAAGEVRTGHLAAQLLRLPPFVFFGKISYSLYLWHWPLLMLPVFWLGRELRWEEALGAVAASIALSALSWRFVEQPFRRRGRWPGRKSIFAGATLMIALCIFHAVRATEFDGYPKRLPSGYADLDLRGPEFYSMDNCIQNKRQDGSDWQIEACTIPGESDSRFLLWGDSFLGHYRPGLTLRETPLPVTFVEHAKAACPPGMTFELPSNPTCASYNAHARELLKQGGFDGVVLGADWTTAMREGYSLDELSSTVTWLQEQGLSVVVIGQSPTFARRVAALYAWGNMGPGRRTDRAASVDAPGLNEHIQAASNDAVFVDPRPLFCEGEICRFGEGDRLYFWDRGHYTLFGSRLAVDRLLLPAVEKVREDR